MTTRRQFVRSLPAFAVTAAVLEGDTATAAPAAVAPAAGHFHPKGKPPSEFTKAVLLKAKQTLPFADTRDFDEQRRGLIAPMPDLTIKTDAGDVVWDMTRFQFLDQKDEFDTVHPSMHRIGQLNNNYGLYEVDLPPLNEATLGARIRVWSQPKEGDRCHEERSSRRSRSSGSSARPRSSWLEGGPCPRWCGSLA